MRFSPLAALCLFSCGLLFALGACQKGGPPPAMPEGNQEGNNHEPGETAQPLTDIPETEAGCKTCNGVWGVHGLAQVESCLCRTNDAGKTCRDGAECQGACLAGEDDFEVVEKGPPARGFYRGKCSEFTIAFGCHLFVPKGARQKGPQEKDDAADPLCID